MEFNSSYEQLIYTRTYSKWIDELNRRETWDETVNRYRDFFIERVPQNHKNSFKDICESIKRFEVMPSMRSLWTAGKALERENIAGYNCATLSVDSIKSFAELLYILMAGAGSGFSVERQYITKLPDIPKSLTEIDDVIIFADSRLGWTEGFYRYMRYLYDGKIPMYDLSKIRAKGKRLKTFGGRASGPEPLEDLLIYTRDIIKRAAGRKLNSLECHDICCKIAFVVVVGGVRRSACISLSNLSDQRMAKAKIGQFWEENGQRIMANNSVAYTEKPDPILFMEEWLNLMKSKSGERGIFNREGAKNFIKQIGRRDSNHDFSPNPCLVGNTLVKTDKGDVKIKDLVGHKDEYKVFTYNIETDKMELERIVIAEMTRKMATVIEIELDDGVKIELTPDHKVYTENRGYVEASKLNEDDIIICIE